MELGAEIYGMKFTSVQTKAPWYLGGVEHTTNMKVLGGVACKVVCR